MKVFFSMHWCLMNLTKILGTVLYASSYPFKTLLSCDSDHFFAAAGHGLPLIPSQKRMFHILMLLGLPVITDSPELYGRISNTVVLWYDNIVTKL